MFFGCDDAIYLLQDRASEIYKKVEDQKSSRGRNQDAILAACLYIACRQEDKPRTVKGTALVSYKYECYPLCLCLRFIEHVCFIQKYVRLPMEQPKRRLVEQKNTS